MPLWNHPMPSMRLRRERSCFTTRRSCLQMVRISQTSLSYFTHLLPTVWNGFANTILQAINGSQSWQRQLEQMRRIDKTGMGFSFVGGIRILYIEERVFIGLRWLWQHIIGPPIPNFLLGAFSCPGLKLEQKWCSLRFGEVMRWSRSSSEPRTFLPHMANPAYGTSPYAGC